jgi:hypothetical protein
MRRGPSEAGAPAKLGGENARVDNLEAMIAPYKRLEADNQGYFDYDAHEPPPPDPLHAGRPPVYTVNTGLG